MHGPAACCSIAVACNESECLTGSRGYDTDYRPTDYMRLTMIKWGLVHPGACGAHSYFCIGVQCRG
jgi:hypothetical protein